MFCENQKIHEGNSKEEQNATDDSFITACARESIKKLSENNSSLKEQLQELSLKILKFPEEIQAGILDGTYYLDGADVKNSKTKRIVKKATVNDFDLDNLKDNNLISEAGKKITSIVGQAQLYEIAEKLEELTIKVDTIHNILIDGRDAELEAALKDLMLICEEGKFSDLEIARVNNYIHQFSKLSAMFEKELNRQIGKNIYKNLLEKILNKFLDSQPFINLDNEDSKIINQLNTLGYLQKGYVLSKLGLIKCYEITGEILKGNRNKQEFKTQFEDYSKRLSKYTAYLIHDRKSSIEESKNIDKLIEGNKDVLSYGVLKSMEGLQMNKGERDYYLTNFHMQLSEKETILNLLFEDYLER